VHERLGVELIARMSPLQEVPVQDRAIPVVVVPLGEMGELVDDDVFQAVRRLLCGLATDPGPPSVGTT